MIFRPHLQIDIQSPAIRVHWIGDAHAGQIQIRNENSMRRRCFLFPRSEKRRKDMKHNPATMSLEERFNYLFETVSSERFLKRQGVSNEVPFFIYSFPAKDAVQIEKHRNLLARKLAGIGIRVLDINLYDLAIELLKERGIFEDVLEMEPTVGKDELLELLQGVLDPEEYLAPAIGEHLEREPHDVLFLSGVGEVYPYIRSHSVLNNLQTVTGDCPVVLFFPGEYTQNAGAGASLDLFDKLPSDKYYRAFDIFTY